MEYIFKSLSKFDITRQKENIRNEILNYLKDIREDFLSVYEVEEKEFLNKLLFNMNFNVYENKEEFTKLVKIYNELISIKKNLDSINKLKDGN